MICKTEEQIAIIQQNCAIVNTAVAQAVSQIKEGVTTRQLDATVEAYIRDHKAEPSFKGYMDYPFATCISVNDAVVHGMPNDVPLQPGDIVSIDAGAFAHGYHSDSAYSVLLLGGTQQQQKQQLLARALHSLSLGIAQAITGQYTGDIGHAIQEYLEGKCGYGVVRDLVGHGLGENLHEPPNVPNYGRRKTGHRLPENLVIAIEPMVNLGKRAVYVTKDKWTIRTKDRSLSAHFEHVVAIKHKRPQLLTSFVPIEDAMRKNLSLANFVQVECTDFL